MRLMSLQRSLQEHHRLSATWLRAAALLVRRQVLQLMTGGVMEVEAVRIAFAGRGLRCRSFFKRRFDVRLIGSSASAAP